MEERIYEPGRNGGWGVAVWQEMIQEQIHSRELVWRLFVRDFTARYKQSILGVLWALILPLMAVSTFVLLNRSGLLNVGDTGIPYSVYVLLGLTVWQVFAGGLTACSNAIVAGGSMVVKINFPKKALVIAAMGQVIFELLVRIVLVAIVMIIFQMAPSWTAVFFPLILIPVIFLTLGLGFFLSLLNVLFRDVVYVVTLATTFLMFLTPVVYPPPDSGSMAVIMNLNPLSALVTASRDVIVTGYLTDPLGLLCSSVLAIGFFLFSWRVFHLTESRIAERV